MVVALTEYYWDQKAKAWKVGTLQMQINDHGDSLQEEVFSVSRYSSL
jgi:hypothetical protein